MSVLKFGGTSLADAAAIRRVAKIIAMSGPGTIAVLTAYPGVTDLLRDEDVATVMGKHASITNELLGSPDRRILYNLGTEAERVGLGERLSCQTMVTYLNERLRVPAVLEHAD